MSIFLALSFLDSRQSRNLIVYCFKLCSWLTFYNLDNFSPLFQLVELNETIQINDNFYQMECRDESQLAKVGQCRLVRLDGDGQKSVLEKCC